MGELGYEYLRSSDSYCFTFSDIWLKKHGYLFLSDDLNNYPGQQYTQPGKDIFGCFSDALPDRWGRTLLLRREQLTAMEEKRAFQSFTCRKSPVDASQTDILSIQHNYRLDCTLFEECPDFDNPKIPPLQLSEYPFVIKMKNFQGESLHFGYLCGHVYP